jgi:hypothetical protein
VWTSSNHLSFLGFVAHFSGKFFIDTVSLLASSNLPADASLQQRDVLIAFCNLYSDHTRAAQAFVILRVLDKFSIASKFGCFVGHNASNNNNSELINGLNKHKDININSNDRIRCAGHIISLVVKATLYGRGVSKFEADLAAAAPLEQLQLFRAHGVVGKLHNFVNAVCASHKRREAFLSVQKELSNEDSLYTFNTLQLRQDGGVRWHSVSLMLLRCLELKEPIKRFMWKLQRVKDENNNDVDYNPLTDCLTDDEWDSALELVNFLACQLS